MVNNKDLKTEGKLKVRDVSVDVMQQIGEERKNQRDGVEK